MQLQPDVAERSAGRYGESFEGQILLEAALGVGEARRAQRPLGGVGKKPIDQAFDRRHREWRSRQRDRPGRGNEIRSFPRVQDNGVAIRLHKSSK